MSKLWSFLIKKDGKNSSKNQRFKCKNCSKRFTLKKKNTRQYLLTSYIEDKKILNTLAKENKISISSIQRSLKSVEIAEPTKLNLKELVLLIDITYWGTSFGVVVFKDAITKSLFGGIL